MGKCNNYTPDIQAQGDCILCGCAFEDHEAKKEYKPMTKWAPFRVGERFANEAGTVILEVDKRGLIDGAPPVFWRYPYTPLDRDTVEPESEETAAPEYNNGKWHGWNGGECPVHPESVVHVMATDGDYLNTRAANIDWSFKGAFLVVEPYVEPSKPIETKTTAYMIEEGLVTKLSALNTAGPYATKGTMTTTTQDGKCIRVVWEPDNG